MPLIISTSWQEAIKFMRYVIKPSDNQLIFLCLFLSLSPCLPVSLSAGVLYNQFLSQTDFEVLRDRAKVGSVSDFSEFYSACRCGTSSSSCWMLSESCCSMFCRAWAVWCGRTWLTGSWWWRCGDTAKSRNSGNDKSPKCKLRTGGAEEHRFSVATQENNKNVCTGFYLTWNKWRGSRACCESDDVIRTRHGSE